MDTTRLASALTVTYSYVLSGNNLNLSGGALDGTVSFTRAGGSSAVIAILVQH